MLLEQRFELPQPPAVAWPAFRDIDLLVDCLPGASLTGPAVDGDLPMRFDVRLGPIAAGFIGSGRATFDDAVQSGRFEGAAADRKTNSRVKGSADFSVAPAGTGSVVTVRVDYTLSGSLAQLSRGGIVRELASTLTAQFAANLEARLAVAPTPAAIPAVAAAQPAETSAPSPVLATARASARANDGHGSISVPDAIPQQAIAADRASMTSPGAQSSTSATPLNPVRPKPANAPLDGGRLLRQALRGWFTGWWHRLTGPR